MCRLRGPLLVGVPCLAVLDIFTAAPLARAAEVEPIPPEHSDTSPAGKIGRVHDRLRRAKDRDALYEEAVDMYSDYATRKARVEQNTGLYWSMDAGYTQQWGWPDGGSPAGQLLVTPNVNWELFNHKTIGEGSVQLAYVAARYATSSTGTAIQTAPGLITPINDYPQHQNIFSQLSYTHSFPGNELLLTIGQYPFGNFDTNAYLDNQQQNFNNYDFAQNGSMTYPNAGLGAYAQLNATSTLQFAAGFQSAANISGATLSGKGFGQGGFAWFGYAQWTPTFQGRGASQYSITYYQVPTVPLQSRSAGWSVNAV